MFISSTLGCLFWNWIFNITITSVSLKSKYLSVDNITFNIYKSSREDLHCWLFMRIWFNDEFLNNILSPFPHSNHEEELTTVRLVHVTNRFIDNKDTLMTQGINKVYNILNNDIRCLKWNNTCICFIYNIRVSCVPNKTWIK